MLKKINLQQSPTTPHLLRFLPPLAVVGGFFISLVDKVKKAEYNRFFKSGASPQKTKCQLRTFKLGGWKHGSLNSSNTLYSIQTAYALMVCGFLCACTFADPPPFPVDQSQVFNPDELLLIDSYPSNQQNLVSFSIANAQPLPPLSSPPEFPTGTVVVVKNVYVTNNIPPAPRKVFELIPSTSKDGTNFVYHPVSVFVDCKEDNEYYRLLILNTNGLSLVIPQYRTNLISNTWIDSDIHIAISGMDTNVEYRIGASLKGIKK